MELTTASLKAKLIEHLSQELLEVPLEHPLQSSDDLLSGGLLDSMSAMRLVDYIEQSIGIRVPPEDITLDNFISVDAIVDYLEKRTHR